MIARADTDPCLATGDRILCDTMLETGSPKEVLRSLAGLVGYPI